MNTMVTGNQFTERAQQQFNQLDAEAKRILRTAIMEEPEHIEWETETVFSKKKNPENDKGNIRHTIKTLHDNRTQ